MGLFRKTGHKTSALTSEGIGMGSRAARREMVRDISATRRELAALLETDPDESASHTFLLRALVASLDDQGTAIKSRPKSPDVLGEIGGAFQCTGQPHRFLIARSVAALFDCSDRTLRRWAACGKFPPPDLRIGGLLRWNESIIRKFIDSKGVPSHGKN